MQGFFPLSGAAIRLTPVSPERPGIAGGRDCRLLRPNCSKLLRCGLHQHHRHWVEPPEGAEHIIIFADNDENFAGQAAAYQAAHRLALRGIEVEVVSRRPAEDWLDHLIQTKAAPDQHPIEAAAGNAPA